MAYSGHDTRKKAARSFDDAAGPARDAWKVLLFLDIHALAQFLARLEVRHVLRRHLHLFPRLGVAPGARRPVIQAETAETPDLDALTLGQALPHGVQDHLHRELRILRHQLRIASRQLRDQLGFGHGVSLIVEYWLRQAWP